MGVDARWVCWTCKDYCAPGWRDMLGYGFKEWAEKGEVRQVLIDYLEGLREGLNYVFSDYGNDSSTLIKFLDDLIKWLRKHKGHRVKLTNDHDESIDWYEFERYRKQFMNEIDEDFRNSNENDYVGVDDL